ncbi:MAG TPA: biopolymer transporter ExbD [Planctomycetota bacterium]|nr:biopolymer transporter ExbD [Planctomycetota bacterium]
MKKRNGLESRAVELQMTAMIDITFLLLVFFLLGTDFREPQARLDARLPTTGGPAAAPGPQDEEELVVRVMMRPSAKRPVYRIGELTFASQDALENKLAKCRVRRADQSVTIDADASAPCEAVIGVLDSCIKTGYVKTAFAAAHSRVRAE